MPKKLFPRENFRPIQEAPYVTCSCRLNKSIYSELQTIAKEKGETVNSILLDFIANYIDDNKVSS